MDVTVSNTREVYNGKDEYIDAPFVNFDSPLDSVKYLTKLWYKDYKGYKGINNAGNAIQAAAMLKQQGYATDPVYAESLQRLIRENKKTTQKVAKGNVTYPEGTYMSPSSGTTGGASSPSTINMNVPQAPAMNFDQLMTELSSKIAQVNQSRSTSVAPAAAPTGGDMVQSSGAGAINQAVTDVKSQIPQLIMGSIPNPIPINIGSAVQTVYTTINNPMAMAKTVLGGLF